MKLKNILLLICILALFFTGCTGPDNTKTPGDVAPFIKSITVTSAAEKIMQGKTLQFNAAVAAGNGAGEGIIWSIYSEGHNASTTISGLGLLKADINETSGQITVRATSAYEEFSDKYGEKIVSVEAAPLFEISYGPFTGGNVTGPAEARSGATVMLNIVPLNNNALQSLTVTRIEGGTVYISGSGSTRNFTMPEEAVKITASFYEFDPYFSKDFDTSLCSFYDKFEGTLLNRSKWDYQNGNGNNGWGNQEKQYYRSQNITVSDGILRIEARREDYTVSGTAFNYTSGKLVTATGNTVDGATQTGDHFIQTYGRFEAKMRLTGPAWTAAGWQGIWPAFWMMPRTSTYGGWPRSGEIDIMEMKGRYPTESSGTIHMASTPSGQQHYRGANQTFEYGSDFTDWHVYGLLWTKTEIVHLMDGKEFRRTPFSTLPTQTNSIYAGSTNGTPYDKDFFLILNLAVGGNFDGGRIPDDDALPIALEIEWVRAYTVDNDPWPVFGTVPGRNFNN